MRNRNLKPYSSNRSNLRRTKTGAWLGITGLLLFLAGLAACSKEKPKAAAVAPVPVRVLRVEAKPLDEMLDVSGSLVSSVAVDVKTEFAGRLVAMLKQEGDRVGKEELLGQLEDVNARLALGQARANLDVAKAALDRARVAEEHAGIELERAQNLLKSGGITDRDYQAAQMTARDSRAQVKLAEAQVEQAHQTLALSEKRVNDCRILSPINGEVERKFQNPGSWLDGNALLYRLVDNQHLELQAFVASSEMSRVAKGQRIRFHAAAFPGAVFSATILNLSAAVDSQNRSLLVRAAVSNSAGNLRAGMFVKGGIVTGTKPAAVVVPPEAIWRRTGQPDYIFIVEENHARRREIQTGIEQTQGIEVTRGLNSGEVVVLEQNLGLADGVRVVPQT